MIAKYLKTTNDARSQMSKQTGDENGEKFSLIDRGPSYQKMKMVTG